MKNTRSKPRFWNRWAEHFASRVVVVLSVWLQRHSSRKWREVAKKLEIGGTQPPAPIEKIAYEPFKRKSPETLYQQGSPGDTLRQKLNSGTPVVLPDWAKEIQPFLMNQLSAHTKRAYETDLKQFFFFLEGKIDPADLSALRAEHIILYRKALEEGRITGAPLEKSTVNRKLAVVKSFMNWLKVNRVVADNPAALVKGFPQSQESSLKGLSDEEVRRMLEKPNRTTRSGSLHAAILSCLLYLGLRKGELIDLKMGDLDEERGVPVIKVRGKGHKIRILPITRAVKDSLEHYFFICRRDRSDKEAPLFIPTKNPRTKTLVKMMNPNAISYIVIRYAKKVGILKQISPHSCRATCISNALDRKATQRSVQHLAGWSTPLMIQRYDKRREELKNSAAFLVNYEEDEPKATATA